MSSDATIINREHWLNELVRRLEPIISEQGYKLTRWRISCGFPVTRARPSTKNAHRIGECWGAEASADKTHEMFISPLLAEPLEVAEVTLHELLHSVLPAGTGHRGPFARLAKKVGLEGKPTSTHAGDALKARLKPILDDLGPYPHAKLDATSNRKTRNPLIKTTCPECGYNARVTRMWLEESGTPICPQCHTEFVEPDSEGYVESPLTVAESSVEFKLKGNERFTVRLIKRGQNGKWYVFDWGEPVIFGQREARVTPAENREDAVNLIESITAGLFTYKDLEYTDDAAEDVEFGDESRRDEEQDWRDVTFLDDDEDETADNADAVLTAEELADYEREQEGREACAC